MRKSGINRNEQNNTSHRNQHYKKIHWELDDSFIDDLKQFEKYYNYSQSKDFK
jgi:hypothetical protein